MNNPHDPDVFGTAEVESTAPTVDYLSEQFENLTAIVTNLAADLARQTTAVAQRDAQLRETLK